MKIYGHPFSTCTRKVLATLGETGTPYEFVLVDFAKGEHKQPAHLARQPFGQVPALDDDGFEMYESRAMCRYICDKAGSDLLPRDLKRRAIVEQWISIEAANFSPHAMKYVYKYIFKRDIPDDALTAAADRVRTAFGIMEKQLGKTQFIAGDSLSLADLCFAPYLEYLTATPGKELLGDYPNVTAWWGRVSERPSWQKAIGKQAST